MVIWMLLVSLDCCAAASLVPEIGALIQLTPTIKERPDVILEAAGHQSKLLVTTGLWYLDTSKRGDAEATKLTYGNCMSELMSLNTPMAIYGDADALSTMLENRSNFNLSQLISEEIPVRSMGICREEYAELVLKRGGEADVKSPGHDAPFFELGCVWNGKVSLIRRTAKAQPGFDWYGWSDICSNIDHGTGPWPRPEALAKLSPDKITVAQGHVDKSCDLCTDGHWGYCHCIAAGAFIVPASLTDWLDEESSKLVKECLSNAKYAWVCLSEQVVLTQMKLRHEDRFEMLDEVGWGAVAFNFLNEGSDDF